MLVATFGEGSIAVSTIPTSHPQQTAARFRFPNVTNPASSWPRSNPGRGSLGISLLLAAGTYRRKIGS